MQGARKLSWAQFEKALELLAQEKRADPLSIARAVAAGRGPRHNATTAAVHVRLHDDKSTYTGAPSPPPACWPQAVACLA